MPMSAKTYNDIAEMIRGEIHTRVLKDNIAEHGRRVGVKRVTMFLCSYFAFDNPSFDRQKFLADCEVDKSW